MKIIDFEDLDLLVEAIKRDEIVAFPTETVFGLGTKGDKEENYRKLVEIKGRDEHKPISLMCSNIDMVKDLVEINDTARKIIAKFCPGPITLVLKAKENIPYYLDLGSSYIGVRIPDSKIILDIIDKVGTYLLVTSANISNQPPALTDEEVYNYFNDKFEYVLKGKSISNIPSTVIKIEGENVTVLREGELTLKEIMEAAK